MLGIARWKRSCSRQVIFRKRDCGCHAFWRNDRLVQFVKRCSRWSEKILASDPKGCPQGSRWGRGRSGKASTTDLSVIARRATAEQERSHGQNIPLFSKSRCSRKFPTRFGRTRVGSCSKIGGDWRGIATRYAKRLSSYLAAIQFRCALLWLSIS